MLKVESLNSFSIDNGDSKFTWILRTGIIVRKVILSVNNLAVSTSAHLRILVTYLLRLNFTSGRILQRGLSSVIDI